MKIKGLEVNYIQYGNKKNKNIVLLHGWGQNTTMMNPIGKKLEDNYYITNIDLPGFGNSEEPEQALTMHDYYEIVKELLKKLKIDNPILIGHSFGGSISILYASMENVEKLILLAAPFRRKNTKDSLKTKILKFLKKVPIIKNLEEYAKQKIGSDDYKNSSKVMREVLVNVVNEDITEYLKKITIPTLLIWGTKDDAVSIEDAKYAEGIMKDAGLVVYENCTHYAYLERLDQTINVIKTFIK